jgi:mono/diheme cytochrome c family protein
LQQEKNPFRVDEKGEYSNEVQIKFQDANPFAPDSPASMQAVKEGGAIFFQNCHFCHGDNLNGRGMFAFAFNPIPANFTDSGTIAQLQETFVFWRVAKGGPGLPREGFPWASAMPPWEEHLQTDEIWKVIAFEYWHTGFYPRTWD